MIAAEGDEVQIVSAMPAFQTRRHTSSVEVVVARRSDHRHASPQTDLATPGSRTPARPRAPGSGRKPWVRWLYEHGAGFSRRHLFRFPHRKPRQLIDGRQEERKSRPKREIWASHETRCTIAVATIWSLISLEKESDQLDTSVRPSHGGGGPLQPFGGSIVSLEGYSFSLGQRPQGGFRSFYWRCGLSRLARRVRTRRQRFLRSVDEGSQGCQASSVSSPGQPRHR